MTLEAMDALRACLGAIWELHSWASREEFEADPAVKAARAALSKEVQASEAVAWQHRLWYEDTLVWSEWRDGEAPSYIDNKVETRPLYATPQPLPATNRGVVTEAMVEALLSGDLVGHIVDVAITRCRALHDYSGRPAWEDAVDGAIREVVTARAAALSVPAPGTGEARDITEGLMADVGLLRLAVAAEDPTAELRIRVDDIRKSVERLRGALSPSTPVGEGKQP